MEISLTTAPCLSFARSLPFPLPVLMRRAWPLLVVAQAEDVFVVFLFLAVRVGAGVGAFPDRDDKVLTERVGGHHEAFVRRVDEFLDALFRGIADRAEGGVHLAALAGVEGGRPDAARVAGRNQADLLSFRTVGERVDVTVRRDGAEAAASAAWGEMPGAEDQPIDSPRGVQPP